MRWICLAMVLMCLPILAQADTVILPAPDWSAPSGAPAAPGDSYNITCTGSAPGANAPVISEWTKTAKPNDSFTLTGVRFTRLNGNQAGSDTTVWLWAANGANGTLRQCKLWKVWNDNVLTATVPADVPMGEYLVWVENNAGASVPVAINKTQAEWVGPLGTTVTSGQSMRVFGKNMSYGHGTSSSNVYIQFTSGGSFTSCTVTNVEPEAITFTVPAASGTFNVFVHNGQGNNYGWSQCPLAITIATAWSRGTGVQTVNPGGGNDATAIQSAIDTVTGYANGGTVQLGSGTFNCGSNVTLKNNVKLLGAGQGSTTVQFSAGELNIATGAGHVTVQDMTVRPTSGYALSFHSEAVHGGAGNTDMLFKNDSFAVNTDTASSIGFYFICDRFEMSSCTFQGVLSGDGADWWLHGSTLYGARNGIDGGLSFAQGNTATVHGRYVVETNSASTQNWPNNGGNRNYKEFLTAAQISALVWNARLLYYQMGSDSYENSYISHNTTTDVAVQDNKGESILFHSSETSAYAQVASNSNRTLTIRTDGYVDGTANFTVTNAGGSTVYAMTSIPNYLGWGQTIDGKAYVIIVGGTGVGQINKVASHTSTTVTVQNDWRVQPDSTSKIMINYIYRNHIQYANTLQGFPSGYTTADGFSASSGVNYDGGCFGNVSEANTNTRTYSGDQLQGYILAPSFFNEMRDCISYTPLGGTGECLNARQGYAWWAASGNCVSPFSLGNFYRGGRSEGRVQSQSIAEIYTSNYRHLIGDGIEGMTISTSSDGYYSGNLDDTLFRNNTMTLSGSGTSVILEKNSQAMLDANSYSGGGTRYAWTASSIIKINTGDTGDGNISGYLIDQDYSGGSTATEAGTPDLSIDPLPNIWIVKYYRNGSSFSYTIPSLIANNSYKVRLHFVEPTFTSANQRKFNVTGNGTSLLSNYDIWADVGKDKAVYKDFNVTSNSSGQIVLQFTGVTSNAVVSALEITDNFQWKDAPNPVLHVAQFTGTAGVAVSPIDIGIANLGVANCTWSVQSTTPAWASATVQSGGTVSPEAETGDLRVSINTSSMSAGASYGTVTLSTSTGKTFCVGVEANLGVAAPTFSPAAGTYSSAQSVTISSVTTGTTIRYTTDGSTPSQSVGTVYSSPVNISGNTTLKAIAYVNGVGSSPVTSGDYVIQVAAPTFNPGAGTYTSAQSVTISTTTSGATIRYTTNGSTPSQSNGTVYSSPVSIGTSCTLKAIAYKSGMTDSNVTSGTYTLSTTYNITQGLYNNTRRSPDTTYTGLLASQTGSDGWWYRVDTTSTPPWTGTYGSSYAFPTNITSYPLCPIVWGPGSSGYDYGWGGQTSTGAVDMTKGFLCNSNENASFQLYQSTMGTAVGFEAGWQTTAFPTMVIEWKAPVAGTASASFLCYSQSASNQGAGYIMGVYRNGVFGSYLTSTTAIGPTNYGAGNGTSLSASGISMSAGDSIVIVCRSAQYSIYGTRQMDTSVSGTITLSW